MKKKYQRKSSLVNKTGYTPGYETENNPYNIIPGENITMENTPYPLYAMPLNQDGEPMGKGTVMQPGGQYRFGGASYVAEVPMYKDGGLKEKWVSKKIGILMRDGYPQKQAIAIAYSMYDQKHKDGGYQLPKYQLAGTAELDEYGQPLPKPQPNSTPSTNSQTSGQNTLAPGNVNSWDIDNNGVPDTIQAPQSNPLVESKPDYNKMYMEMSTEDEQLKESEDVTADARNTAENSFQGNPMYQFLNLEGGFGTDAALFKTGQAVANKNTLGIVAGAGTSLIKGAKDFLAGMGTQNRQNQVMKSYYKNQRENMTGTNRAKGLRFGGYYQDGGEEEYGDLVNKYPNRNPQIRQENTTKTDWFEEGMDKDTYYGFKNQLEAEGYKSIPKPNGMSTTNKEVSTPSARDTWVAKTGLPWSEAKRLGYTDGSAKDNMKLLSELNDPRFKKEYLRKRPLSPAKSKVAEDNKTYYGGTLKEVVIEAPRKKAGASRFMFTSDKAYQDYLKANKMKAPDTNTGMLVPMPAFDFSPKQKEQPMFRQAYQDGGEQQGGGQEQQIMQEVAQALQQGADPQQIVQQLVQMGIPQQQAIQMVQMVMQQLQGSQEQSQQQGTPQLRMGGYYQEGGEEMDEEMEGEYEGAENESPRLEQIEDQVEQALKQGADPQQVLQQLVQMGIPQQQAIQMIQEILQEIQNGESEMEDSEEGQPMMRVGGEYLSALKGKTIKDYTYNPKTNSYTVSYE